MVTLFQSLSLFSLQVMEKLNLAFELLLIFRIGYLGVIFDFNFQTFQYVCKLYVSKENDFVTSTHD